VQSVLESEYPAFELIVVDQNDDETTANLLAPFATDNRFLHIRDARRGKCFALNLALSKAKGALVALTDDDCEVPRDWLSAMSAALVQFPGAAIVYCNVVAAEHDAEAGFIPVYVRKGDQLVGSVWQKRDARGIGAGMALRKQVILDLGGFDVALGPGGPFYAVDEWDLTNRALVRGYQIYETDRTEVRHHGFRSHGQGREVSRRTWFGIGAAYAKPVKCGHFEFLAIIAYDLAVLALWPILRDTIRGGRPRGFAKLLGFAQGFAKGLRTPVDSKLMLYKLA
jgi:glycosyltransferase involved in cell wall biosynthesis